MSQNTSAHSWAAALEEWWQEFASVQAQLGIEALPSPEELSLQVTANGEVFVPKLCIEGEKNPPA